MEVAWAAVVDRAPAVSVGPVATPGWDPASACATLQGAERAEPGAGLSPPDSPVGSPHPLSSLGLVGDTSPSSGMVSYGVSLRASKTQRAGALRRSHGRAIAQMPGIGRAPSPWAGRGQGRAGGAALATGRLQPCPPRVCCRTSSAFPPPAFHPHPTWSGTPHGRPRI